MGGVPSFPITPLSRDRIYVVTGGNTGLGFEISKWLAFMGGTVILACRSEERAKKAIEAIKAKYDQMKEDLNRKHSIPVQETLALEFTPLDLASFKSTLKFVDDYKKSGRPLHVLICNAGIGMAPLEKTEDGLEKMLQVNYLSHFLLTAKLLPVMSNSGNDCRILLMSSDAHRSCRFDLETMNYEGDSSKFGRLDYYGRSKLYQIMQMFSMARRLQGTNVSINSSHPGVVHTEINRSFSDLYFWNTVFFKAAKMTGNLKTPIEGATSMINAAVNPDLAGVSGQYYKDCKQGYMTSEAKDSDKQEALWQKTLTMIQSMLTEEERNCLEGNH